MSESVRKLVVDYPSVDALQREYRVNLRFGFALAAGSTVEEDLVRCSLVLNHPSGSDTLELGGVAVWASERGTLVQLAGFDKEMARRLKSFASGAEPASRAEPAREPPAANVQERIRGLNAVEQRRVARSGTLAERVALERLYGKNVWEPLLQNLQLTPPEVARIARMGALPKPLLESIVANPRWITAPIVRRALLTNPRLGGEALTTVLRAMPRAELQLVPTQTAYPSRVREAAKGMVKPRG